MHKPIIIVGAGSAGIGLGIVLKKMKLDFVILEKGTVGESFQRWPDHTHFLSPSFAGNFFGSPDLNAICPDTSPAHLLGVEHPNGLQYAAYLNLAGAFYQLPIQENTEITGLTKSEGVFNLETKAKTYTADYVIWAAGEFQFPKLGVFEGDELAIHSSHLNTKAYAPEDIVPIIGGYESGFDSAIGLAQQGIKSVIFDAHNNLADNSTDSSHALSPYTKQRLLGYHDLITIKTETPIERIEQNQDHYFLTSDTGESFEFKAQPVLATGYSIRRGLAESWFEWQGNTPLLTENDESTTEENFFLAGSLVKHGNVLFCFIYKFRQRFAIIAETIAERMGADTQAVQNTVADYQNRNFYLKDLTCCENECVC